MEREVGRGVLLRVSCDLRNLFFVPKTSLSVKDLYNIKRKDG